MKKILIGSPIRQGPEILKYFLDSLRGLETAGFKVDYMFIDDNQVEKSSFLLKGFRPANSRVVIIPGQGDGMEYIKDNVKHHWNEQLVWKVAGYKNSIIKFCLEEGYDYLLLVDSDLVLHPRTLLRLVSTEKDIISEIFWTRWNPGGMELPQVWLYDSYTLCLCRRDEDISNEEKYARTLKFLETLRKPGVYRVGGLGALTLFSRYALDKGVYFNEIYNLSFSGEDRHLCVRAVALGFELFVDTYFPAYHLYRQSDLEGVSDYIASYREMNLKANRKLILNVLKDELEDLENLDFRAIDLHGFEVDRWKEIFTPQGWGDFNYQEKAEKVVQNRAIYRAEIVTIKDLKFNADFSRCQLTLALNIRGSEKGERIEESRELGVQLQYTPGWKIDHYVVLKRRNKILEQEPYKVGYNGNERVIRTFRPKITLAMLVRNEAGRYLPMVLEHAARYIDEAVILDDASEDDTVQVCKEILKNIPSVIISNAEPGFINEVNLRKQLWELVIQTAPDWILILDSDEMFEERAVTKLRELVRTPAVDVLAFRLYDFWDMEHYREDKLWNAHLRYSPFLVRYQPNYSYRWNEKPLHCGRFPANIHELPAATSDLRVKHFGWAREEDRKKKYQRYLELDPEGKYGIIEQYESILDPEPNLKKWEE